jgi:hypothetical protein
MGNVHARLLERAIVILGGLDEVAAYLDVSATHVRIWRRGVLSPPPGVFLKLVDLVSEAPLRAEPPPHQERLK